MTTFTIGSTNEAYILPTTKNLRDMKIEVTNRDLILAHVEAKLKNIYDARKLIDLDYEAEWRRKQARGFFGLGGRIVGPNEKPPETNWYEHGKDYPCSIIYASHEDELLRIKQALMSAGTGVIYLDEDDMESLGDIEHIVLK